jgi:hypothetical protein
VTPDQLISDYLERLDEELADLPRAARRDVVDDVAAHIAESRDGRESEAEVRDILERLGDPAQIAAEARERFDVPPRRRSRLDVAAVLFLSIGSLVLPILGWFVGLVLLWMSDAWNTRDKILGTLFVPGGLGTLWLLLKTIGSSDACVQSFDAQGQLLHETCSGGHSTLHDVVWPALLIAMLVASIASPTYLAFRLRASNRRAALA